jgi:hypothetical protein
MTDFSKEDNWEDVPNYRGFPVFWERLPPNGESRYFSQANVGGHLWQIRLNNFPDEPLNTLLVDGREIIHFNNFPEEWTEQTPADILREGEKICHTLLEKHPGNNTLLQVKKQIGLLIFLNKIHSKNLQNYAKELDAVDMRILKSEEIKKLDEQAAFFFDKVAAEGGFLLRLAGR